MKKVGLYQPIIWDPLLLSDRQQISRGYATINRRNLAIISRYYVYTILMKVPVEKAIYELASEFFLKERTMKKIIVSRQSEFDDLFSQNRELVWFTSNKDWSHINWHYNPLTKQNKQKNDSDNC